MNYEQKYKEALGWMRELYDSLNGATKEDAEHYFPELKWNDERIRQELIDAVNGLWDNDALPMPLTTKRKNSWLAWLEKQGIVWHSISEEPDEQEELLCEWESEDATWHDIAFYHADTKTFWNGEREIEDVIRWIKMKDIMLCIES